VDIVLGIGGGAVFSGRWKAFAVGHHLLIFCFKLGMLKAMVQIFDANSTRRIYPLRAGTVKQPQRRDILLGDAPRISPPKQQ
jgi:hypothetical protein